MRGFQLFVKNLPWSVGNLELKMYFSQFGHVSNASVMVDRNSGMSRGHAFVTFSSRDGYNMAANKEVHRLEGRKLLVAPSENYYKET